MLPSPGQPSPYETGPFHSPSTDPTTSPQDKTAPRSDTNPAPAPGLDPLVPYTPVPEPSNEPVVLVPVMPLAPEPVPEPAPPAPPAPRVLWGNAIELGGGVTNFANGAAAGRTDPGGFWDVRAISGTRRIVALEAAYVGSLQGISALGLDQNTRIMKHGVEGALRLNVPITSGYRTNGLVEPFAFGGIGYSHYSLTNTSNPATSDMNDRDDIMALPVGAGLAASANGFMFDARFTYRMTYYNDMFLGGSSNGTAGDLNNWSAGANIGAEF